MATLLDLLKTTVIGTPDSPALYEQQVIYLQDREEELSDLLDSLKIDQPTNLRRLLIDYVVLKTQDGTDDDYPEDLSDGEFETVGISEENHRSPSALIILVSNCD